MTSNKIPKNAFDFLRICAAFGVLFSHSYPLIGQDELQVGYKTSLGTLGVFVFFVISGYLIQQSWDRSKNVKIFLLNRLLRIYPGLIACLSLSILVLALFSNQSFAEFYANSETHLYFLSNVTPVFLQWQDSLPGVFNNYIYPNAVNGSLWSIRYEVIMYFVLLVSALATKNNRKILSILFLFFIAIWVYGRYLNLDHPARLIWFVQYFQLEKAWLLTLTPFFLCGAIIANLPEKIFRIHIFILLGMILILLRDHQDSIVLFWLTIPYCTIYLALKLPHIFHGWARHGDFSYGVYLYAFPVQQMISNSRWIDGNHYLSLLSSIVAVSFLAVLSWHWVESPALRAKKLVKKSYVINES